ncbi:MAG: type II secretion system protein GspL [Myxococcota bacterium]
MVMFERSVLGLDIGSQSLKAVELKISPRRLAAGQFRAHPCLDENSSVAEDIRHFLALHRLPTDQVACALPASQCSTRRLEFPFSEPRRLDQAIPYEIEAETPFDLEDIFVDWNLLESHRNHSVVAATLVKRKDVGNALAELDAAGCNPQLLEAGGLVLANLAPIFELDGSHLIADIGHERTTFCAMHKGRPLLARSLAVGGRAMTECIAQERGLSLEDAEHHKHSGGGLGTSDSTSSPGVVAILDRIAREAVRTLEAAEAIRGDDTPAEMAAISLIGGGAQMELIDDFLTRRTGRTTEKLRMPPEAKHANLVEGIDPLVFGSALALALRLAGEPVTRMNFRQGQSVFRKDFADLFHRQLRPTIALAATLVLLLVVSTVSTITLQYRRASLNLAATTELYRNAFPDRGTVPSNPVGAMGSELRNARERADFLGLYSGDRSALDLLAELSRTIPADLAVRITEINIDRNMIRLDVDAEGFEAADRLTSVLSQTRPFQSAKVAGSIQTDRKTGGVSFDVSIPLSRSEEDA